MEEVWVPLVDFKGVGFGVFVFWRVEGLAIGEDAATDGWAVLGGLAVTVEEIKFVGFGW